MKLWVLKGMSVWECPKKFGEMHLTGKDRPREERLWAELLTAGAIPPHFACSWSSRWSLVLEDPSLGESLAITKGLNQSRASKLYRLDRQTQG